MKRLAVLAWALAVVLSSVHGDVRRQWGEQGPPGSRPHSVTITEFGAVGDGRTLNTLPFQNAVFYARSFADKGGAQLYVPKGRWLTGSFNLTSHLTLFLEEDAIIIGTKESSQWPVVEPLPSYGQGLDLPGPRHRSLINGYNLTDVVITGNNGVIDGQGSVWWDWLRSQELNHSRPHLVEFLYSKEIVISNLTFFNSPAWSIHPVYCSNVKVHNITIKTSLDAPFTDGIVPDSCLNVCIEDSTISVSHDAISVKSGWDKYGISMGRPASDIHISRVDLQASSGAALAFGSEMSGGISDIHVDHLKIHGSSKGFSFKTTPGRGGYIKEVVISDVEMDSVLVAIEFTGNSSSHPDDDFDPSELPVIDQITLENMVGTNISVAGVLSGIEGDPFTAICLSNLSFSIADSAHSSPWSCANVSGYSESVSPSLARNFIHLPQILQSVSPLLVTAPLLWHNHIYRVFLCSSFAFLIPVIVQFRNIKPPSLSFSQIFPINASKKNHTRPASYGANAQIRRRIMIMRKNQVGLWTARCLLVQLHFFIQSVRKFSFW